MTIFNISWNYNTMYVYFRLANKYKYKYRRNSITELWGKRSPEGEKRDSGKMEAPRCFVPECETKESENTSAK